MTSGFGKAILAAAILCIGLMPLREGAAQVAEGGAADLPFRYVRYHASYDVNADGTHVETHAWEKTLLKEQALGSGKEASFSFSTSLHAGEVVEAYTRKPDGRRLDVPKANYQVTVNDGKLNGSPMFSDWTTVTAVFPDVTLGDTVVFAYRIVQKEAMFPGHFSLAQQFSPYMAYDELSVRVTAPVSLALTHESHRMTVEDASGADGRRTMTWRYANPAPPRWSAAESGIRPLAEIPGLYVSTFASYADVVAAYGARARPKAQPTERVRALAAEIVAGKQTPREQARALYDWVSRHITYGGNCIGVGAVVPHDTDAILDNRMGDCKDHATLLQALLAARGIVSSQALINASGAAELPAVPVVSMVNHVINYLPDFALYVDSTAADAPFDLLPQALAQKPVLLVDNYRSGVMTQRISPTANRQRLVSRVRLLDDGSAEGETEVVVSGIFAVDLRAMMRKMPADAGGDFVRAMFARAGLRGDGSLIREDASELTASYRYRIRYRIADLVPVGGSGGMHVLPLVWSPAPVAGFLQSQAMPPQKYPVPCGGGVSVEEHTYELPRRMRLLSTPKAVAHKGSLVDYSASYRRKGNVLHIRREFNDKTPVNLCSPNMMADYQAQAKGAFNDVRSQILYAY